MAIDESGLREYRRTLEALRVHLTRFGVREWPARLERWLAELDVAVEASQADAIVAHIGRSQRATGGMGSIGDVFISPEAGDRVPSDDLAIRLANDQLNALVNTLYQLTLSLLGHDVRQVHQK